MGKQNSVKPYPRVMWQSGSWRIVRVANDAITVERTGMDSMQQPKWEAVKSRPPVAREKGDKLYAVEEVLVQALLFFDDKENGQVLRLGKDPESAEDVAGARP